MPARISVALSKEFGPPECEELGVTCTLEFSEDSPTLQIQRAVQIAVEACHRALHEEATRP